MRSAPTLRILLAGLVGGEPPPLAVTGLACDSRRVRPGELFFAVPGAREDGAGYAGEAVARGAAAVVAARPLPLPVPCLVAPDVRRAVALAADRFYEHPSARLACVGVTGTNGKTTTCHLVAQLLERAGRPFGILGTVGHSLGGRTLAAATTTPGPVELQALLAEMAGLGLAGCALEVSSHALDQERAAGVRFRVGVFTNLTRDHLDYHREMGAYAAAKARLFAALGPGAAAVVNGADPWAGRMLAALTGRVRVLRFRVGAEGEAEVRALAPRTGPGGTRFRLATPAGEADVELPLPGIFNVENALAAAGACLALGLDPGQVAAGLADARPAPGRLEPVPLPAGRRGPLVFVDYAHTPDALERVLQTLRPLGAGRLAVVFGCGGDRDPGKRPLMGAVAARLADQVWITSDNPRSEDPGAILARILEGAAGGPAEVAVEPDRREAIRRALAAAGPEDVVLLAGKGHEAGQIVGNRVLPFRDAEEAGRALCGS